MRTLLKNIGSLATPLLKGKPYEIQGIDNAALTIVDGVFDYIGRESEAPMTNIDRVFNCHGGLVTPGLIDCHTHPVFAATREKEFHLRNTGVSYTEIAAKGGGIRSSVRELRKASIDYLIELLHPRFDGFIESGTTTIEAKSGYGLSLDDEIKSLEALKEMKNHPLEVVPTFLGAHEIPDEYRSERETYIGLLIDEMIPTAARRKLAEFCDIFVEKKVYTPDEARKIMSAAQHHGLKVRLHVDQLTSGGGAELAAELGAVSAEHLDYISDDGIEKMIQAGVIFDLLPGAVFFLGHDQYPPARKIIEKGGTIALATDFNPGSSMTRSLPLMMTIACVYMRMTADEVLTAVTLNAAKSLNREHRLGSIESGKQADAVVWNAPSHHYLPYHYGENLVCGVFKNGEPVYKKTECPIGKDND